MPPHNGATPEDAFGTRLIVTFGKFLKYDSHIILYFGKELPSRLPIWPPPTGVFPNSVNPAFSYFRQSRGFCYLGLFDLRLDWEASMHHHHVSVLVGYLLSSIIWAQPSPSTRQSIAPDLEIEAIEDRAFVVTHTFPWPANSLLVQMDASEFVLVDTPWTDAAAEALVTWLRQTFGSIHITVINTHFHRDNLGGNGYFLAQGFPVYGSDLTVELLEERGPAVKQHLLESLNTPKNERYHQAFAENPLLPPDHVFPLERGLTLTIAAERVVLFFPGPAHTRDNIVVFFPKRSLLFGGCMVRSLKSTSIGFIGDADLEAWPQSAQTVLDHFPDARIVVPGHGAWGDRSLIRHTIDVVRRHEVQ